MNYSKDLIEKILIILLPILLIFLVANLLFGLSQKQTSFSQLSPQEKQQRVVEKRDLGIKQAMEAGDYRCCINPPCTMCYMEANQWNNFQAGTCACDDLIAQGKEPCPQCKKGLCPQDEDGVCQTQEN